MKTLANILATAFVCAVGFIVDWFLHDHARFVWNFLAHVLILLLVTLLGVKAFREFSKN